MRAAVAAVFGDEGLVSENGGQVDEFTGHPESELGAAARL